MVISTKGPPLYENGDRTFLVRKQDRLCNPGVAPTDMQSILNTLIELQQPESKGTQSYGRISRFCAGRYPEQMYSGPNCFVKALVRHFLPSVVRGVYRADDEFCSLKDESAFARFVEAKLRFLPPNLSVKLRHHVSLSENFEQAQRESTIPDDLIEPIQTTAHRANTFFRRHSYFENALGNQAETKEADNFLEIQFIRRILAPLLNNEGMRIVLPQQKVGPYFLDFALNGASKFALEVDGFGKFKDRRNLDDFIKRQNYITSQGWRVIRFTFGQIMENTEVALKSLHSLLKSDVQLRRFLTVQWHSGFLRNLISRTADPQVMDLVNDFYRIQDHFVEMALAYDDNTKPFRVRDNFELDVPLVALSISALYEFLEAVQSVVDVEFDLQAVVVGGVQLTPEWAPELHRLVTVSEVGNESAPTWDAPTIRLKPTSLPAPPNGAGEIRFRDKLSLNDIRERLQYLCRGVFGYDKTKDFQNKVFQRIFNGQHVLGISATGSGKSFCFWLPSLLKPGLTLVICPLRSLMRDQRLTLRNYGIASAEFINSDVDKLTQRRILEEAKLGYIRLLYISPERLRIKKFLAELEQLQEAVPINFLAVDEAHCISEWGHDFRPSYLKLPFLREKLSEGNKQLQLVALTATAGQQVEQDMLGILKLRPGENGDVIRERVADREKFSYQIVSVKPGSTKTRAYHEILTKHLPKALRQSSLANLLNLRIGNGEKALGIVFCIYADPHGKHSIHDGIAHYLYETMEELEPSARFEVIDRLRKFRADAYATGKVRVFASKKPTLCPNCQSYAYTSLPRNTDSDDDDELEQDDEKAAAQLVGAGTKVCANCKHNFNESEASTWLSDPAWQKLVKENQNDFKESGFDILVATKGFGMGIDKSSVRFIVHTSLSSGLESWYQEVGRAGRDNERAHIVLLVDPPNEACRRELGGLEIKRPRCSYKGGCPHNRESLCDYGKQHMFVTRSYPGAESDAVSALRVLDKLIVARENSRDGSVVLSTSSKYLSYSELAVYRLYLLGLVEDYVVTYQPNPRFEVEFTLPESPEKPSALRHVQESMQERASEHLSHFSSRKGRGIERELELRTKEYQPLENFSAKTRDFQTFEKNERLFEVVYRHLLLVLDHTYKDVVAMRYDMLWNLLAVVHSAEKKRCRREPLLQHFVADEEKARYEGYKCGLCDVCIESLEFRQDISTQPREAPSDARKEAELTRLLNDDKFEHEKLVALVNAFQDYPSSKYRQARQVLEGAANNLPGLFLSREFSPPEEYEGNAKRLLRSANQKPLPLPEIQVLYKTSKQFKSELLLTLNEGDTACDSRDGWKFLGEEAAKTEHQRKTEIQQMRECLDFMLLVDEGLPDTMDSLKRKALELETAFYA